MNGLLDGALGEDLHDGSAGIFDTAAGTRQFLIDLVASERRSPHLPDGLVAVVERGLHPQPARRYRNGDALQRAFEAA